ncbi:hypothetical protein LTR85_009516 [Meristemomyces frigidus]|nr:hypothetical protein LTR85_009516 [Meristemomyces frigidus]
MAALRNLHGLKKLEIGMVDEEWFDMDKGNRLVLGGMKGKYTKLEQIPGLDDLVVAASKANELVILAKVKAGGAIPKKPKKRKSAKNATDRGRKAVEDSGSEDVKQPKELKQSA